MMLPGAVHPQIRLLHTAFVGQTAKHAPQCWTLVSRFVHTPLHAVAPDGHTHLPAEHDVPPLHTVPHAPQCELLVCRDTQIEPQTDWPAGHAHTPPEQACPARHARPQAPQLAVFVRRSTHEVPHVAWLAAQVNVQVAMAQTEGAAHLLSHWPQFAPSDIASTHLSPHRSCPWGQTQALATHVVSEGQAIAQLPQ